MANIKISDLQVNESEFVELSDLELKRTIGGGLLCAIDKILTAIFC
jgi:hypothetical protein